MRKRGVIESCSWSRNSILSRPILPRLRGFLSWFSHPPNARIRFLHHHSKTMHSRGMEGSRGPSTAQSHSLRSWLGCAQDDMGREVVFSDVSGFVIAAGCEG